MAIPAEFQYKNESEFISRLLVPLLKRLGFSIVTDYHGQREFGKDLVFGEIDRFGHVRYHALQAKYESSIGLEAVETLIRDANQAFANPFAHPHTGASERINMFYALNGGSFSDQARQHFFTSLAHPYGGNVRLIDGKALLIMDRWASNNHSNTIESEIAGLLIEINYNRSLAVFLRPQYEKCAVETWTRVPLERFRRTAAENYLVRPIAVDIISPTDIERYWHEIMCCCQLMDEFRKHPKRRLNTTELSNGLLNCFERMRQFEDQLVVSLNAAIVRLSPLVPV